MAPAAATATEAAAAGQTSEPASATAARATPDTPEPSQPSEQPCPATQPDHLPPSARVRYSLQRGPLRGEGVLTWERGADHYRLSLEGQVPLMGTLLRQTSEGGFDRCGVAPLRHTDRRLGKSERALNFVRMPNASELRYSGSAAVRPLAAGTQDRLSWLVQLAARLGGWPGGSPPHGSHITMAVAAVGGDVQHWTFTVVQHETDGLLHLKREPEDPFDTRAEVWADPQRGHWPARVELREARGEALILQLTDWQPLSSSR